LLSQNKASTLPQDAKESLRTLIRRRFERNAVVADNRRLAVLFQHGYEVLDHLEQSLSPKDEQDTTSLSWLMTYLDRHDNKALISQSTIDDRKSKNAKKYNAFPDPGRALFARPLPFNLLRPRLSQDEDAQVETTRVKPVRTIPRLASANRIPFLYLNKPQPHSLSIYFNNRIKLKQRRHDASNTQQELSTLGSWEDHWDEILHSQHGIRTEHDHQSTHSSWSKAHNEAYKIVRGYLTAETRQNRIRSELLVSIVDQEKVLAVRERKQRVMARNLRAFERKRQRL